MTYNTNIIQYIIHCINEKKNKNIFVWFISKKYYNFINMIYYPEETFISNNNNLYSCSILEHLTF